MSRAVRPSDCASRRAGSIVNTTTRRPDSAARRPRAAAVEVPGTLDVVFVDDDETPACDEWLAQESSPAIDAEEALLEPA